MNVIPLPKRCRRHGDVPFTPENRNNLSFCTECVKEQKAKHPEAFLVNPMAKAETSRGAKER